MVMLAFFVAQVHCSYPLRVNFLLFDQPTCHNFTFFSVDMFAQNSTSIIHTTPAARQQCPPEASGNDALYAVIMVHLMYKGSCIKA
uniref:Putative secreted protein n=1 Tax=Rhipicephalus microplus TaxID=6941 RepID=A0A6M2DDW3_RHIMP